MSEKKIFKEFVVKGKKISKWVTKTRETQYDSNGNETNSIKKSNRKLKFSHWIFMGVDYEQRQRII